MDIIAQLKAERDKAAQQVNAEYGYWSIERNDNEPRITGTPNDECRCSCQNLGISKSTLGESTG